jgi:hypothetical protein
MAKIDYDLAKKIEKHGRKVSAKPGGFGIPDVMPVWFLLMNAVR